MLPVEIVACAPSRAGAVSPIRKRTPQRITANEPVILCTSRISPPFSLLSTLNFGDISEADGTPHTLYIRHEPRLPGQYYPGLTPVASDGAHGYLNRAKCQPSST